jgi:two-component system, NarL family, sensor kinase
MSPARPRLRVRPHDPPLVPVRRRPGWRHPVVQFLAAGLVALVALILVSGWLSERAATEEAVIDARNTTELLAESLVEPAVTRALLDRESAAVDKFDRLVEERVLVGPVLRVKIWSPDGTIVYSDRTELIGERFELDDDELDVLWGGGSDAEASALTAPENRYEREEFGRLLEVYTRVETPDGSPLLFEAYFSYDDVTYRSSQVLEAFRPITIAGLLVFLVLTVPLVWVLARRLDAAAADRERLLQAAVEASDAERRRIARDLHDGVVQDLAGTSFALSATARDLSDRPETAGRLESLGMGVRQSLRALRSLLVEIYPPDLRTEGLGAALDDLVAPAAAAGIDVELHVADTTAVPDDVVALAWRTAQEAVRNALRHGSPGRLTVGLTVDRPGDRAGDRSDRTGSGTLVLEVRDDGIGFDAHQPPQQGHLGLRGLSDLVHEAGGRLEVTSAPGAGTRVRLEVPTT